MYTYTDGNAMDARVTETAGDPAGVPYRVADTRYIYAGRLLRNDMLKRFPRVGVKHLYVYVTRI